MTGAMSAEQRALDFLREAERLVREAALELARDEGIADDDAAGFESFRFAGAERALARAIEDVEASAG